MKSIVRVLILPALICCASCQQPEPCSAEGQENVSNISGRFYFDDRFDRYVLHHHVPGTIDSFMVFIFCDDSIENAEDLAGTTMRFTGKVGRLKEDLQPTTMIAGEEFFVVVSTDVLDPAGDDSL